MPPFTALFAHVPSGALWLALLGFGAVLAAVVAVLAFARHADEAAHRQTGSSPDTAATEPAPTPRALTAQALQQALRATAAPAPSPADAPVLPPPAAAAPQRPRLLVADDSAVARAKLRRLFESAGYDVDTAENGQQALERVTAHAYAVLITDLEMPVLDGFELIAHIQGGLETEDLPVIAITGHEALSARVHDCQGLYGIFRKPWNDRELLKRVAAVATLRRAAGMAAAEVAG